jgi:hypothetical protein
MIKAIMLFVCIAACSLSLDARAQDASSLSLKARAQNDRQYTDGVARGQVSAGVDRVKNIATGEEKMSETIAKYTDGPVTEVDYIRVDYGHFETYIDWLNSTWKPTMEAAKKGGLIIDYKVLRATPKTPDQPNIYLMITYKNMASSIGDNGDKSAEFEAVTEKVIGSLEFQNEKRVERGQYRTVLGSEVVRELILK